MRTIIEDLNYAMQEPASQAAAQAQKLGLAYVGFGRYEDPKTKQITHIVQNDKLVPFRKAIKTNSYRSQQSDDIGNFVNALSPDTQQINDALTQSYPPQNYDESELSAIQQFANQSHSDINTLLAGLPANINVKQIQPTSADDNIPDIISALDSAMKKSRSPLDFITYVKLNDDVDHIDLIPGSQFKFKGFRNTSINLGVLLSDVNSGSTILQIRVKKNSRGIYVANYSATPEEAEFVLPRGCKIEVLSGPTKLTGSDSQSMGKNREIHYYDCITKS